jgi:signal-transduction protein with cAMP-binding, CBS, and nucleotidyltransferase domain
MDANGDGRIDLEEFISFAHQATARHEEQQHKKTTTLILIGRAKAGSNLKNIKLNTVLEKFGGGGHPKAASATVRLESEGEASEILQRLVDELVHTGLQKQLTVGDFMTAPVLSVKVDMAESQVEDLFTRYDVRALPVVDDNNDVVGLVTYKEVAQAKVCIGMSNRILLATNTVTNQI